MTRRRKPYTAEEIRELSEPDYRRLNRRLTKRAGVTMEDVLLVESCHCGALIPNDERYVLFLERWGWHPTIVAMKEAIASGKRKVWLKMCRPAYKHSPYYNVYRECTLPGGIVICWRNK